MPKVTVVIPCYNGARYLGQAIDSVLNQTYSDYEIVVVDDGSTDATAQVVAGYGDKVRYLYQENQGLPAARNRGVASSTGDYLTFLDADDLLLPNKLARQVAALEAEPRLGLVASGYQCIDENGWVLGDQRPWNGRPTIDPMTVLIGGLTVVHAVLLRRFWFDRVGGFDPSFRYSEDMDLWYRLCLAGCPMGWVPAVVCQYRIHAGNMSRNIREHYRWTRTALDKLFARPDLPTQVAERREDIYAMVYLAEAGRLYAVCDIEAAKEALSAALRLSPHLCDERTECLSDVMVAWQQSVWNPDGPGVLRRVFENLPSEPALPTDLVSRVRLKSDKALFYDAFTQGDAARVWRQWVRIALRDPLWLRNRGSWSIPLRALVAGKRRTPRGEATPQQPATDRCARVQQGRGLG